MKKLLSLLLALTMILPLVGCAAFAENADPIMITVIATSDVHGKVLPINYATGEPSPNVGLSMIASMIEQVRATEKNVVLVDGGDTVQGSAMTYYYSYFAPEKDDPMMKASCVMDSVNIDLYIDAEEDTEAYCISAGVFRKLMQQNVHVRCYAYQMTAERFSDSMWTMQQVLFMSADRRLAIFLSDELAKTGGDEVRMTHDQIAKYMGSAREVVSRMLKYFAQEGWVRLYRGGVQVLDKKKLQQLARGQ